MQGIELQAPVRNARELTSTLGLLICILISENQGLEKSRSASKLRKISGPANLYFFLGLHLEKARFIQ